MLKFGVCRDCFLLFFGGHEAVCDLEFGEHASTSSVRSLRKGTLAGHIQNTQQILRISY